MIRRETTVLASPWGLLPVSPWVDQELLYCRWMGQGLWRKLQKPLICICLSMRTASGGNHRLNSQIALSEFSHTTDDCPVSARTCLCRLEGMCKTFIWEALEGEITLDKNSALVLTITDSYFVRFKPKAEDRLTWECWDLTHESSTIQRFVLQFPAVHRGQIENHLFFQLLFVYGLRDSGKCR